MLMLGRTELLCVSTCCLCTATTLGHTHAVLVLKAPALHDQISQHRLIDSPSRCNIRTVHGHMDSLSLSSHWLNNHFQSAEWECMSSPLSSQLPYLCGVKLRSPAPYTAHTHSVTQSRGLCVRQADNVFIEDLLFLSLLLPESSRTHKRRACLQPWKSPVPGVLGNLHKHCARLLFQLYI